MTQSIDIKKEEYSLSHHNPNWAISFQDEKNHLQDILPHDIIWKIEHIWSTAIQNIKAKPIIDMLMEVKSQQEAQDIIAPLLEAQGYTHIIHTWLTADEPAQSSWFIKRNNAWERTHHIRCAEKDTSVWRRVLFVRHLNEHPAKAKEYEDLKVQLIQDYPWERRKYLEWKWTFINQTTQEAMSIYTP